MAEAMASSSARRGRIQTKGRFQTRYGEIEARVNLSARHNGLWPAFWILGSDLGAADRPAREIEAIEALGKDPPTCTARSTVPGLAIPVATA